MKIYIYFLHQINIAQNSMKDARDNFRNDDFYCYNLQISPINLTTKMIQETA